MLYGRSETDMARKRLTQIFPFLLPLRKWQRKLFFYWKMRLDKNRYAAEIADGLLPHEVFRTESLLLNENSGYDMQYQHNKVFNLQLAAKTVNHLLIRPGETFSFWMRVRNADRDEPYKDGLVLVDGKIVGAYGGGLCQISSMLFWMFLHTPLTIVERHGHAVESFPTTTEDLPSGTDATVTEGWLDLKVKNETAHPFQLEITFADGYMIGRVLSDTELPCEYEIYNASVDYYRKNGRVYQEASVERRRTDKETGAVDDTHLYRTTSEIGYELPDDIEIIDKGE